MQNPYYNLLLSLLLFVSTACSVDPIDTPKSEVIRLEILLRTLNTVNTDDESKQLSKDIFRTTNLLTKKFELTSPPLWHNFLVNVGLRQKGLCFHWSDALYLHLKQQKYTHFSFHLVGANIGSYFLEHNALVVSNKKEEIANSILIDPWRNSGKLYFSKIEDDTSYSWEHRLDRGCE